MKTMYRLTIYFGGEIKEHQVLKETDKQVVYVINGREIRESKIGSVWAWFDKKNDAIEYVFNHIEENIQNHKRRIEDEQKYLAWFKSKYCSDEI